jgi:hypothetical protein
MNNGRVDTLNNENYNLYKLFQDGGNSMSTFSHEATTGIHQKTALNDLFFSQLNVNALQQGIKNMVAVKSNGEYVIGNQSEVELQVVMRAIYLQEAMHGKTDIVGQVRELNSKVLDFCVPRIMEEVRMYRYYKNDVSKLPTPLDRGSFQSSKGTRVNEFTQF